VEPDRGTVFRILFPAQAEEVSASIPELMPLDFLKGKGTILFVDDEHGIIASGRGILETLGYDVVSSEDPIKALEIFSKSPHSFDCILTDMTMPGMTGIDLSTKIIEIRSDIPIIICSGSIIELPDKIIRQAGIKEMITKPLSARELARALFKVLNLSDLQK